MAFQHKISARGSWARLSLAEQLGNIGSEVGRATAWEKKDAKLFDGAKTRALELFDLTLDDSRWKRAAKNEVARAREVFCDAIFGGQEYGSTLFGLERYFFHFAFLARNKLS